MAKIYVTEYRTQARDGKGNILPAGEEPPVTVQVKDFTGTHGVSDAFDETTTFVRVYCDGDACVQFGLAPVAVNGADTAVKADTPEFFGLNTDFSSMKVSAVTRT